MFGKATVMSREAIMRSLVSMSATASWRKNALRADGHRIAPQTLAGISGVQVGAEAAQEGADAA